MKEHIDKADRWMYDNWRLGWLLAGVFLGSILGLAVFGQCGVCR